MQASLGFYFQNLRTEKFQHLQTNPIMCMIANRTEQIREKFSKILTSHNSYGEHYSS